MEYITQGWLDIDDCDGEIILHVEKNRTAEKTEVVQPQPKVVNPEKKAEDNA